MAICKVMMPCRFGDVMACKLLILNPGNTKVNLPTIIVYVLLFNATTGKLLAITVSKLCLCVLSCLACMMCLQEGESITKRRTAAASALSAKWLAPKQPEILAIFGSGFQAVAHIQVLMDQYPTIR